MRERIGKAEEELDPPPTVATVGDLMAWLSERGEGYAHAFESPTSFAPRSIEFTSSRDATIGGREGSGVLSADDRRLKRDGDGPRPDASDFDAAARSAEALARGRTDIGAVVSFVGSLPRRGRQARRARARTLSRHGRRGNRARGGEAEARWPLLGVTVIHRYGRIAPGERIVLVVAAAAHRAAAFAAAEMLMDYLKTRAPFWKRAMRARRRVSKAGLRRKARTTSRPRAGAPPTEFKVSGSPDHRVVNPEHDDRADHGDH